MGTSLPFLFLPLLLQYLLLNERILKTVLTFFVHFTLLFCVIGLLSMVYHSFTVPIAIKEWVLHPKSYYPFVYAWSNYDHPSVLCVIYLLALPVGLYLKRKYRTVSIAELTALIAVETAMLIFTGARVGMIIFPLLLLWMLFYRISLKRKVMVIGLPVALAGVMVIGLLGWDNQFTDRFKDPIRIQLWETAIASIKERPLLGTGTGGMKAVCTSPELTVKLNYPEPLSFNNPHNQYLGEIMHFGFIGATALSGTLIYLLILAFRKKDFLLQSLLLILFIQMFTEMPFDSHKGIYSYLFFISLFVVSFSLRADTGSKTQ
jgi:O-antigen ligase